MDFDIRVIFGIIILIALVGMTIYKFVKLDNDKKITIIKQWLKLAVVEAEKYFGGGTGQLKLRWVYTKGLEFFPWLATLVTFEVFSEWVDDALEWMKNQFKANKAIKVYAEVKDEDENKEVEVKNENEE